MDGGINGYSDAHRDVEVGRVERVAAIHFGCGKPQELVQRESGQRACHHPTVGAGPVGGEPVGVADEQVGVASLFGDVGYHVLDKSSNAARPNEAAVYSYLHG